MTFAISYGPMIPLVISYLSITRGLSPPGTTMHSLSSGPMQYDILSYIIMVVSI